MLTLGRKQCRVFLVPSVRRALCVEANVSSRTESEGSSPSRRKIVVFGGNGYLGQHIVSSALQYFDADVVSISRSGAPKTGLDFSSYTFPEGADGASASAVGPTVKWVKGDLFDSSSWSTEAAGADGAVSCVGAFGSNAFMEKVNGEGNIQAISWAMNAGVPRFVYISTTENNLPEFVLAGYFKGKRMAEAALKDAFPGASGVVLRPGFIYGTRSVPLPDASTLVPKPICDMLGKISSRAPPSSLELPLWLAGKPMETIFSTSGVRQLRAGVPGMQAILAPPIAVQAVARVAAAGALGALPSQLSMSPSPSSSRSSSAAAEKEAVPSDPPLVMSIDDIVREARALQNP